MKLKRNCIDVLWDELREIMRNDESFNKILEVKDNVLKMAIDKHYFRNNYLIGRIFGLLIPLNSKSELTVDYLPAENSDFDSIVYHFNITTKKCYYRGSIIVTPFIS